MIAVHNGGLIILIGAAFLVNDGTVTASHAPCHGEHCRNQNLRGANRHDRHAGGNKHRQRRPVSLLDSEADTEMGIAVDWAAPMSLVPAAPPPSGPKAQAKTPTAPKGGDSLPSDFKIFVHTLPSKFNKDLLGCYESHYGKNIWADETKERSQNAAEVWMHRLLMKHPRRTHKPEEATAFFVPFYGFLSTNFSGKAGSTTCGNLGHLDRVSELAKWLQKSEYFKTAPNRHVFPATFWAVAHKDAPKWDDEIFSIVTGDLYDLLGKSTLLVYEPQFSSFRQKDEYVNWHGPLVVVPYLAMQSLVDDPAINFHMKDELLYFRGNVALDSSNSSFQSVGQIVRNQIVGFESSMLLGDKMQFEDSSQDFSVTSYSAGMLRSEFCLVPRGDTPTSRRLFDAIAAGCIPVIVADGIGLPFSNFLDWDAFSLKVPEDVFDHDSHGVTAKIGTMSPGVVLTMQAALAKVRDDFVYGRGTPNDFKPGRVMDNVLLSLSMSKDFPKTPYGKGSSK